MIPQAGNVPNIKTAGAQVLTAYSKKWNAKYWQTAVLPDITTSAYFDELSKGDKVEIPNEPTIAFSDYENGQEVVGERITPDNTSVTIDQAGKFAVYLTKVDKALSHLDLAAKYQEGGQRSGQKYIDEKFFTAMKDAASANNKGATAGVKSGNYNLGTSAAGVAVNTSNVVRFVTSMQAVLTEQNANEGITWCVIPPWLQYLMVNSELKNAMMMGDPKSALRTGFIGTLWGMKFYVNTYLPGAGNAAGTPTAILAGNKAAISYTLRMNEVEIYNTGNFEDRIQGLMVWGWKCVKTVGLVNAYAYMAAEA